MTKDVVTVQETDDVKDAARLMKDRQIRRVVVVGGDKKVVGIVSLGDIAVDAHDDKMSGDVLEKVSADVPRRGSGNRSANCASPADGATERPGALCAGPFFRLGRLPWLLAWAASSFTRSDCTMRLKAALTVL
jgi:CBS domain-containing protein